jgi:hypothetical protein
MLVALLSLLIVSSVAYSPEGMSTWLRVLQRELKSNPYAGYFQLATVEGGKPRVRTVLFSGFAERDGKTAILFKTSKLSRKFQSADNSAVEICWWMEQSSVQFRFQGEVPPSPL